MAHSPTTSRTEFEQPSHRDATTIKKTAVATEPYTDCREAGSAMLISARAFFPNTNTISAAMMGAWASRIAVFQVSFILTAQHRLASVAHCEIPGLRCTC